MRLYFLGVLLSVFLTAAPLPITLEQSSETTVVMVRDEAGNPVPFADIAFGNGSLIGHERANAQGVFTGVGFTTSQICADVDNGGYHYDNCVSNLTFPSSGTVTVTIVLPFISSSTNPPLGALSGSSVSPSRGWITGAVTLAGSGAPVAGVTVQFADTPIHTSTDAAGRYQFPGVSTTDGRNGGPTYTVTVLPPAAAVVVGTASQQVTVRDGQGSEADFIVQPAFTPFWVESFVPDAAIWSGSDQRAIRFGTRPQWSRFLVVAVQQGPRLYVYDPSTSNYAWIDAASVGPSGPPGS